MDVQELFCLVNDFLIAKEYDPTTAMYLNLIVNCIAVGIIAFVIDYVIRRVLIALAYRIAPKTKNNFDDFLIKNKLPQNVAHLIPVFFIEQISPFLFVDFPDFQRGFLTAIDIFLVILVIRVIRSILNSLRDFLKTLNAFKDKPIDSYIQVFMIFVWTVGIILSFSILTGKSIVAFVTTLGALSAVILLIFRDTILGFVASIQVAVNDMVRIGDWITMENYGADGDVIEINLATVKVQNFDKTITTIPTYALISDSFKNWRGMNDSGGRRIKRSIIIKTTSIHYLSDEEIESLKKIQLISDYLVQRQEDIEKYNGKRAVDKSLLINGRNMTNIGVFRKYVESYLETHPAINKEMTIMSRQLAQTPQGIPLEIYAFSQDKVWKNYEYIMGDIFDHLLAAVPFFYLEVYELEVGGS
ncbi:mechanosensitive ion channel domain-containing protein [Kordia algicida OT-1]|uniref:Mechanosensing system component YbdG n=1 Tax=Kordia algicida OT-1 TaxID=391587 RepID=A9E5A9_9FLAO|nr:mechanosensitive ion channel domain-containing protein [Kordia algicida]EDP95159.1 putative membrane transport protein [Kordia algicida OT-1]